MTRLPLRNALQNAEAYGAPQLEAEHLLNVNENPYPVPQQLVTALLDAIREAAPALNRYPDRDFSELRGALAEHLSAESPNGLDKENIWAANGSNEVMQHLMQAFGGPGRTAMGFSPTYSLYHEYARNTCTEWVDGSRSADFQLDPTHAVTQILETRPALVLLPSPNNPTGTALPVEALASIAANSRTTGPDGAASILVVDEAYVEFRRDGGGTALALVNEFPHVAVTRTMSKAFSFAGARLGYLAGTPDLVRALELVRLPYHLSSLTQAAALVALQFQEHLLAHVGEIREERDRTIHWLRGQGLIAHDSDANFVLFGEFEDRHEIWRRLLERGVLVRESGPAGHLRVTIGTPAEMVAFRSALTEAIS